MAAFKELGIGWKLGVASGWGTYGVNLAAEAAKRDIAPALFFHADRLQLTEAHQRLLKPAMDDHRRWYDLARAGPMKAPFPLLHALGNGLDFSDDLRGLSGTPTVGVAFFEHVTIPQANRKLARDSFAAVIAGSSWNTDILKSMNINVRNCPQGIDPAVFAPGPRQNRFPGRFAIFSGGKLEYRKGQDLVVAAFKRFHNRHPDALLVTAWHNPWPHMAKLLAHSPHVAGAPQTDANGLLDIRRWLLANGLPEESFIDLGALANVVTADTLREMDVAVMPSRCEGGTNLVAMECMACGVPTILSRNTGHVDLIAGDNCYRLDFQIPMAEVTGRPDLEGWGESSIDEIVTKLEQAYTDRADAAKRGTAGAEFMKDWSWSVQIERLLAELRTFT